MKQKPKRKKKTAAQKAIAKAKREAKKVRERQKRHRFYRKLNERGLPCPTPEYIFHETRQWRMDYAWIDAKVALEVEGGVWSGGRHTRPQGFLGDMEKYNEAAAMGYRLIRCQPSELMQDATLELIARTLNMN